MGGVRSGKAEGGRGGGNDDGGRGRWLSQLWQQEERFFLRTIAERASLWQYLLLSESLSPFGFALPVILHDHHGGVDFPHRQVCRC